MQHQSDIIGKTAAFVGNLVLVLIVWRLAVTPTLALETNICHQSVFCKNPRF